MALTVTNRGSGTVELFSAGDDITVTPTSNFNTGLVVLCLAYDNTGTNGADPYSSISDSNGNTWTSRVNVLRDPGAADEGVVVRVFTTSQNGGLLTTSDVISINVGTFQPSNTWTIYEVSASIGTANYVTGGTTSGVGTSGTITSSSITIDNAIIGVTGIEQDDTVTADSDTSDGSWSSATTTVATDFGSNALTVRISSQSKVVTATATQTYNTSWATSADYALAWVEITETIVAAYIDPFGAMGFFGI